MWREDRQAYSCTGWVVLDEAARALLMEHWPVFIVFIVCWPGAVWRRREHYHIQVHIYGMWRHRVLPKRRSPPAPCLWTCGDWRSINDEHVRSTALQKHFVGDAGRHHTKTGCWARRALI
jgi:hypothetical protein